MIQRMLAIWSLVPLPFLNLAWTTGSSWFMYCWSLAWKILSITFSSVQFSPVQLLSHVRLFVTPTCQASLSITNSWSPTKPMSIESVTPSNHLILCHPLLLLPSIFPSIRVFSNESALRIRGQSIGVSASTSVLPMNTQDWSHLEWTCWISLQSKGLSRVFSNTTVQKHQFFSAQLLHSPTLTSIHALLAYEMSAIVQWFEHSLALPLFGIGKKTDLFQSCGHGCVFQICWHIECSTLPASSFRIWNSSTGIPSPPLALLVGCFLRPTWLRIPECLALGWWPHHCDYLGHEDLFCIVVLCILATSS